MHAVNSKRPSRLIRRPKTFIIKTIVFIVFFVYAVTLIYPFLWMGLNALKDKFDFARNAFNLPSDPLWGNFGNALVRFKIVAGSGEAARSFNMLSMFGISIALTAAATVGEIFFSALAAYTVAFYKFPLRKVIYAVIIFTLSVPLVGTLPAMYKFMIDVRLWNTIPSIMFLYVNGIGFSFLLLYGSFKNLSWSYAEAASIDGAGHFRIFFKVMLPLSMPFITSAAIIAAIGFWNNYETPAIFLPSYPTISVGINAIIFEVRNSSTDRNNFPLMFASMIISIVPIVVLFASFQKVIMKNMSVGGIKG